jgi:hypothetical protein
MLLDFPPVTRAINKSLNEPSRHRYPSGGSTEADPVEGRD